MHTTVRTRTQPERGAKHATRAITRRCTESRRRHAASTGTSVARTNNSCAVLIAAATLLHPAVAAILPWEVPRQSHRVPLYAGSALESLALDTRERPETTALRFLSRYNVKEVLDLDEELYKLTRHFREVQRKSRPEEVMSAYAAPVARVGVPLGLHEKYLVQYRHECPHAAVVQFLTRQDSFQHANASWAEMVARKLLESARKPDVSAHAHSLAGHDTARFVLPADVADDLSTCPASLRKRLKEYADWHRGERAKLDAGRTDVARAVVFACANLDNCNGLADRLAGFTSVFVFALKHKLLFFSQWTALDAWMSSPFVDWRINSSWAVGGALERAPPASGQLIDCKHRPKPECGNMPCQCIWQMVDPYSTLSQFADANGAAGLGKAPNPIHIATNRGAYAAIIPSQIPELVELIGHDMGCMYWALFRPTPALRARAGNFIRRVKSEPTLGVHVRAGDDRLAGKESSHAHVVTAKMFEQLQHCTAGDPSLPLLVLSDDSEFVRVILQRYPQAWSTGEEAQHINPHDMIRVGNPALAHRVNVTEALGAALTDWLVLSECERLLVMPEPGFSASGFTRTAMAYSKAQRLPPSQPGLSSSPACPLIDDMDSMVTNLALHGAGL